MSLKLISDTPDDLDILSRDTRKYIDITDRLHVVQLREYQSKLELLTHGNHTHGKLKELVDEMYDTNQYIFIQVGMLCSKGGIPDKQAEALSEIVGYYHGIIKKSLSFLKAALSLDTISQDDEKYAFIFSTVVKLKVYLGLLGDSLFILDSRKEVASDRHVTSIRSYQHTLTQEGKIDMLESYSSDEIATHFIPHFLALIGDMHKQIQAQKDKIKKLSVIGKNASDDTYSREVHKIQLAYEKTVENIIEGFKIKEMGLYTHSPENLEIVRLINEINILLLRSIQKANIVPTQGIQELLDKTA